MAALSLQSDSRIVLRLAAAADLPAINDIYNHYVAHSTCTYQVQPETLEARSAWFADHGPAHPVIVAVRADQVVGWGSLSSYKSREAYRFTVEDSVYVRHDQQHRGIGSALLARLVELAQLHHHHSVLAIIDGAQAGSIALHERFGFAKVAQLVEVGYKFDRWLDVVYLQRML
ncbi:MAG: N-acetyltransferase [Phycisphaeraceae bacterium]|nr:N-acetyltransferase [Phycisphaeraceae bacterium]